MQRFVAEARAFIDSLGKPIRQVYLSHAHHEQLMGIAQYPDAALVTSDSVFAEALLENPAHKLRGSTGSVLSRSSCGSMIPSPSESAL